MTPIRAQHDLEHRLSIFVREEIVAWHQIFRHPLDDSRMAHLRDLSLHSIDEVVKRARLLSCKMERERVRMPFAGPELDLRANSNRTARSRRTRRSSSS